MNISRLTFTLLIAIAVGATVGSAHGQALIGSHGAAGWQSWSVDDILCGQESNGNIDSYNTCIPASGTGGTPAPYWNSEFGAAQPNDERNPAEKNVGFCMTSTGDCQGIGSALIAPGPLKFWALTTFVPGNGNVGSGGARDPNVYFRNSGTRTSTGFRWNSYRATLVLNNTAVPCGVNAFGWFETNSTGSSVGNMHQLFQGTGEPRYECALTPSPVGTTVTFTPTQYFGYYYSDVSEPTQVLDPVTGQYVDDHGCYAYTLFNQNEPNCQESNQGAHDFVVFSSNPGSSHATYWIAGEDPVDCTTQDGDCNLTLVRVSPVGGSN